MLSKISLRFVISITAKCEKGCLFELSPHLTTLFQVCATIFSPSLLSIYLKSKDLKANHGDGDDDHGSNNDPLKKHVAPASVGSGDTRHHADEDGKFIGKRPAAAAKLGALAATLGDGPA